MLVPMAQKSKTSYICNECGYMSPKWMGKCPGCGSWNTLVENIIEEKSATRTKPRSVAVNMPSKVSEIEINNETRYSTGIGELDRVLGGGIVRGELILVGGDPGIGKSTLLLQICEKAENRRILYISGEESESQIKLRAKRLGVGSDSLYVVTETDVEKVCAYIDKVEPDTVIIDSIQTMHHSGVSSAPGSVPQVREATNLFMNKAKSENITMFIVGHVTKDGNIAGPRVLEHMVDCVLYFEGEREMSFRILRCVKNRFGSTNEIGVFDMREEGLVEVTNPSELFLEGREAKTPGSAVVCVMEGTRCVLAEVQSLVSQTVFGNPRRMSAGIDFNKLILLSAVLDRRAHVRLSASDIYINVAGGLRIDEPAADLGVCAAVIAASSDILIPSDVVFIGEVGLGGEIRSVSQIQKRINEAAKLGFSTAVIPKRSQGMINVPDGFSVIGISAVSDLVKIIRK